MTTNYTLNVQQRGRNPYRYTNEDNYGEDLDEEDRAPQINLSRFGQGNENKEVRYKDKVDNCLGNMKLKIRLVKDSIFSV